MTREHTVKSFDEEMRAVERDVLRMGTMARLQLRDLLAAMHGRDPSRAYEVVLADGGMDELDQRISDTVQAMLALRQPLAADMRALISFDRMGTDLERVGDHLKNSARRLLRVLQSDADVELDAVAQLIEMVAPLLEQTLQALEHKDVGAAERVIRRDDELDSAYEQLTETLSARLCAESQSAPAYLEMLFMLKAVERVGDHATNIAEDVIYWVSGARPKRRRREPAAD